MLLRSLCLNKQSARQLQSGLIWRACQLPVTKAVSHQKDKQCLIQGSSPYQRVQHLPNLQLLRNQPSESFHQHHQLPPRESVAHSTQQKKMEKQKMQCTKCNKYVCEEHSSITCTGCSSLVSFMTIIPGLLHLSA